eukprot:PhF_6_TR13402/c0_g1_i1/m.21319
MRGTAVDMDSPQGTLTIRNSVLDGLEQHRPLRVENVESVALQDSLVVRGLAFDGSEDGGGCALLRDISNSVTMDNVTFHSCDTEGNGGCLAVTSLWRNDATTSLIISNSSFERCSAGNVGGMVFAFHALSVDVTHSTFRGGSSNGDGGGIAVLDVETLRMRYVTMYNCTTDHTAGCAKFVAKLPSHTIDILDSQFLQCTARYGVGCIGIQGATFSLNNTNVDHCNATASTSGCVGLSQTKGVLGNTRLSNCYAANDGGGLRISASNVSLTHVALESVRSESGSGGGLYASDKSFVEFENVTIQNAFARHNGTCFLLEKRASAHFVKDIELQCGARHYDVPSRTILVSWVNMTLTENDIFPRKEENQSLSPSSDSPPSDDLGTKQSSTTSSSSSTTMQTSSQVVSTLGILAMIPEASVSATSVTALLSMQCRVGVRDDPVQWISLASYLPQRSSSPSSTWEVVFGVLGVVGFYAVHTGVYLVARMLSKSSEWASKAMRYPRVSIVYAFAMFPLLVSRSVVAEEPVVVIPCIIAFVSCIVAIHVVGIRIHNSKYERVEDAYGETNILSWLLSPRGLWTPKEARYVCGIYYEKYRDDPYTSCHGMFWIDVCHGVASTVASKIGRMDKTLCDASMVLLIVSAVGISVVYLVAMPTTVRVVSLLRGCRFGLFGLLGLCVLTKSVESNTMTAIILLFHSVTACECFHTLFCKRKPVEVKNRSFHSRSKDEGNDEELTVVLTQPFIPHELEQEKVTRDAKNDFVDL